MDIFTLNKDLRICFTTHVDLDGVSGVIVFKFFLEKIFSKVDYYFYSYEERPTLFDDIDDYDCFIYVDIVPTVSMYQQLKEKVKIIFIFDHHKTSYDELYTHDNEIDQFCYYFFDLYKCGTKIFYDYCLQCNTTTVKQLQQYVDLVNIYDCWKYTSEFFSIAKDLNNVLFGMVKYSEPNSYYKFSSFINLQLYKFSVMPYFYFTVKEKSIIDNARKKEMFALKEAEDTLQFRVDNQGNKYAYFQCMSKLSIVSFYLLQKYKDLKYIAGHSTFKDTPERYEPTISLRSNNGFDVSEIAKLYDGGGHPNAAGIMFKDYDMFLKFHNNKIHLI